MSFRDLIDRITGRHGSGQYRGRTRSRSEPTIQLPKSEREGMDSRAITSPENRRSKEPRPYNQPTPPIGAPAAVRDPGAEPRPSPHAPTQYQETGSYKKDVVAGVLVAIDGELKGEVFKLFDGENRLGRSDTSDVVLSSKWISRDHAMVVHQEGVFAIVPLTEKNRTYVNDREVDGAELSDGDTVRLGHTTFRFRSIEAL